jgi:DNA polymerase III epsilon subunit-like protein
VPNLIFLDMETTDIENPRIVQLAYSTDTYDFESKYKPPVPISIEAMSVHHITNRMVEDCTAFEISAHESDLLDPDTVVVAHNAKFDIGVLKNE